MAQGRDNDEVRKRARGSQGRHLTTVQIIFSF